MSSRIVPDESGQDRQEHLAKQLKYRCQPFGAFLSAPAFFCAVMAAAGIAQMAEDFLLGRHILH
jgi:hypothetical protein